MTTTATPFDDARFRLSAAKAVECLVEEDIENLLAQHGTLDAVLDLMTTRARSVRATFARRERSLPEAEYDFLAAAVLSVRSKASVQANVTNIVKVHDELLALQVPAELAVPCRKAQNEAAIGLLVATARVTGEVGAENVPPLFVTMVAAALLAQTGVETAASEVRAVLVRADELAASHRAGLGVADGTDQAFPILGNADIVGQVAAYRVAVAEAAGASVDPIADVADIAEVVALRLRRGLTRAPGQSWWRGGSEPDIVVTFREFAKTIGGPVAAEVFGLLHRELTFMSAGASSSIPVEDDSTFAARDAEPVETSSVAADTLARHVLDALYTGAGPRRHIVTQWLTGERPPDDQHELPFLVDRVRRVAALLGDPPASPPALDPESLGHLRLVSAKVADALLLGEKRIGIAQIILPPLWTKRSAAVKLVQSKLRVRMTRGATTSARSAMVAAVVVRAPAQGFLRVAPERPAICACGVGEGRAPANRKPVQADQACPHRSWEEWGAVEDYSTLTAFAEYSTPDATRAQLRRYTGPWEYWIHEVR
ncbi:hypothetical protein GCM10027598_60880 [Amycolatopsis oliviviridis]|uniref:DUF222 domain-containing protein n=1 Tax=Amycolatopsis oliviviridis TaxID=1471590 RepID=A0ABQ3M472_9PSEU|nr:hypothetical protein [Amycolatopsis oliviviridis]GHH32290.1 hypothetical protein GCM10017790_69180 [Amycolatopsis oliviviridis]